MSTTVTMSLAEFKEMEAKVKAFEELSTNGNFVAVTSYYGHYVCAVGDDATCFLLKSLKESLESRDSTINKVREYERKTGKQVF